MKKALALIFVIFSVSTTSGEEKIKLDEVVVTASKIEESETETTSGVRVFGSAEIEKTEADFVVDVLRRASEIDVVQNGGPGKFSSVLLRGGNPSQTLMMIDGVKINSATTGSFDLSGITANDVERIEIVKGPQSTIYGSEAMAGVINIITKRGSGKPEVKLSFDGGSFGTYSPAVTISGGDRTFDYRLTGSSYYSDGISAAKEGSERDGYRNASASGRIGVRPTEKLELEFAGKYIYDRSELDDFDFFGKKAVDNAQFIQSRDQYVVSGKGKLYLNDVWEQILTLSSQYESLRFKDPVVVFNNADIRAGEENIHWQHNFFVSSASVITAGAEYTQQHGKNTGNFDENSDNYALYLNSKVKLFQDALIMNAGIRYDDYESFGSKVTYRIGALCNIPQTGFRLRGSYGTGFRAPNFNELYFPFYGNPDLEPEESTGWEASIEKDLFGDTATLAATYFDQRYRNLIQTDPLTFTAANVAKAAVNGVEVNASVKVADSIIFRAGYTFLDTKDKATGQELSLRPRNKVVVSGEYTYRDFSLLASYTFVDERFDASVGRELSPYSLVNLSGSYRVSKAATIFARIDNLLDEDYEQSGSFSTPGFSVFGGIRVSVF